VGIGGDGFGYDRCIIDGPFSNYTTRAGPGFDITDRCISRTFSNLGSSLAAKIEVDGCNTFETYEEFWVCVYMYPHLGGQLGLGSMVGHLLCPCWYRAYDENRC
jgi:tyrosinase